MTGMRCPLRSPVRRTTNPKMLCSSAAATGGSSKENYNSHPAPLRQPPFYWLAGADRPSPVSTATGEQQDAGGLQGGVMEWSFSAKRQ